MYNEQESRDEAAASIQIESDKFDNAMEKNELDAEYAEYLMNKSNAFIGNGDMLIRAMESGNYYEGFKDDYLRGEK